MEFGIQLKESGIPLAIDIQNPSSTDKDLENGTWNPESKTVLDTITWGDSHVKWFARFGIKEMLEKALGSSGRRIRAPSIPVHICHPLKQMTGNSFIVLIFQTGPLLFRIQLM